MRTIISILGCITDLDYGKNKIQNSLIYDQDLFALQPFLLFVGLIYVVLPVMTQVMKQSLHTSLTVSCKLLMLYYLSNKEVASFLFSAASALLGSILNTLSEYLIAS